ncbi:DUF1778 domain-containing protein [Mesorhizobium sp. ASY16-5R]|uniref:type II toxin-antitoxin system TacA family antitoxin n=1 Tax=Mesorhizobium sp. ASY16-5R TaxID=3445772 RepID=UPI003FA1559F
MAPPLKKENMNVRITADALDLIKRGALASGKTISAFVLEAASVQAEKALLDQRFFYLDAQVFDDIEERLSKPGEPRPELVELFKATNKVRWANSGS